MDARSWETLHGPEDQHDRGDDDREPREALDEHDDLFERVAPQADHRHQAVAHRGARAQHLLGALLHDGVGQIERGREHGDEHRLIDEEGREGDVAGERRAEDERDESPGEGAAGRPGIARRRAGRGGGDRPGDEPQRARHENRDEGGADGAAGHRDIERGDGVRGRLEQPFGRQDRRDREPKVKQPRADAVAEIEQAPVRLPRRQQSATEGVAQDDQPKSVEQRVERALQPRIGNVEDVERISERRQREQRQGGEHQDRPGGGQRAAQAAGRRRRGIARDHAPRDPLQRRPQRRDRQDHREKAERLRAGDPRRQAMKPIAEQGPDRARRRRALRAPPPSTAAD